MRTVIETNGQSSSCRPLADGDPTYSDLIKERDALVAEVLRLQVEVKRLQSLNEEIWGVVEDVSCGATIECVACGKSKPCCCDK
jgi:hypothetical protein